MQLTAHQPLARGVAAPARLGGARRQARHQPRRAAAGCRAALTVPEDAYLPVVRRSLRALVWDRVVCLRGRRLSLFAGLLPGEGALLREGERQAGGPLRD